MLKYEIRDVVSDYGIYENGELKLIVNSRANAEYIKAILEVDSSQPNAATVYSTKVADMSDEEVLAIGRLCFARENKCKVCPIKNEDDCLDLTLERRLLEIAEKWLDARHAPIRTVQTEEQK